MSGEYSFKYKTIYNHTFSKKGIIHSFWRKKYHFSKIRELLKPKSDDIILDVGCNKGNLVYYLRNYADKVIGIDINKSAIVTSDIPGLNIMPAENLAFPDETFTKIISSHTIEHIENISMAFFEMKRVLVTGGVCVLIYPFEVIRGMNTLFSAWWAYGNPLLARKMHIHKLNPRKIARLTSMKVIDKGIFLGPIPTYFTVLVK